MTKNAAPCVPSDYDAVLVPAAPGVSMCTCIATSDARPEATLTVEREDLPQNIDLRCRVEDEFNEWRKDIDKQLKKFEKCWDIQRGWKAKRMFEGSQIEDFFRNKYNSADRLLRALEDVLKVLTEKSPDWSLTIDRLIFVAGKQAEIDRIFQYFYIRD